MAWDTKNEEIVAVKKYNNEKAIDHYIHEVTSLTVINHKNVVQLKWVHVVDDPKLKKKHMYVFLEYIKEVLYTETLSQITFFWIIML